MCPMQGHIRTVLFFLVTEMDVFQVLVVGLIPLSLFSVVMYHALSYFIVGNCIFITA